MNDKTNITIIPIIHMEAESAAFLVNGAIMIAIIKGNKAIILLPRGTPILRPHVTQVAGMAGPKNARRNSEIPGLPQ